MSDAPLELIVSAFQTERGADEALDAIIQAKKDKLVKIREAAVVRRDAGGKLHISERGDLSTGGGAASGAAIGAVIGLFGGPIGALVGGAAGAAIGGLAAKLIDSGIPDDRLKQIGEALKPGTSAIVAMIEHSWVEEAQVELQRAGGDTLAAAVTEDIKNQLAAGKEVTYSAVAAAGGSVATRTVAGTEGVSVQGIATDGENIIAGAVKVVEDKAADVVDTTKELAGDAGDSAKGLLDSATDAAKGAVATVEDAAKDVAAKAEDAAKDATKAAKDAVS
jgi:uncharacterized membrane protein